jgi:CheY-like chemotaxis protein
MPIRATTKQPSSENRQGNVAMDSPTVLCVDDRPPALDLRKATLESLGYTVKTASNSYAALKILGEMSISAILLEYKQEGMDAEAVACHIKQRFPNLPIILLSAYSEIPERVLWLVDEYAMKSEVPEGLAQVIERATQTTKKEKAHRFARHSNEQCERGCAAA